MQLTNKTYRIVYHVDGAEIKDTTTVLLVCYCYYYLLLTHYSLDFHSLLIRIEVTSIYL